MGVLHVMEFKWDAERRSSPASATPTPPCCGGWPGLPHDTTTDNINLIIWSAARRFPADVMERRGEDLVAGRPGPHRELAPAPAGTARPRGPGQRPPDQGVHVRARSPPWKSSTVTMLGDAIHTMTPGRGVGANTALRDARLLCEQLSRATAGDKTLVQAVPTTRPRWRRTASPGSPNR